MQETQTSPDTLGIYFRKRNVFVETYKVSDFGEMNHIEKNKFSFKPDNSENNPLISIEFDLDILH